jgi:hypothetical protein
MERGLWAASLVVCLLVGPIAAVYPEVRRDLGYLDSVEHLSARGSKLTRPEDFISYFNNIEGITGYRKDEIKNRLISGICYKIQMYFVNASSP